MERATMRRKDREVTDFNEMIKIVDECEVVRLGLADGDYPYIVPVNFAYRVEGEQLYFYIHGAMAGRKYEMLRKNPVCSFEMDVPIGMECIAEAKDVTMRYKSVMGKAKAVFLEGEERQEAIDKIIMARHKETESFEYKRETVKHTAVVMFTVTEMSAKANPVHGGADV